MVRLLRSLFAFLWGFISLVLLPAAGASQAIISMLYASQCTSPVCSLWHAALQWDIPLGEAQCDPSPACQENSNPSLPQPSCPLTLLCFECLESS